MRELGSKHPTYHGVLDIPEGTMGTYKVSHIIRPAFTVFDTSTARGRLMGGQKGGRLQYPHETRWHELSYENGVWMTDYPIEQRQHDDLLLPVFTGSVLVGGLGLGYAATVLARKRGIRSVVVVEKSAEVIALVEAAMRRNLGEADAAKVTVLHADLFDYLEGAPRIWGTLHGKEPVKEPPFTWAYYDIWQLDSEVTFHDTVVPLLRASSGVVKNRPICWNEDVMRGQLKFGLMGAVQSHELKMPGGPAIEQMAIPLPPEHPSAKWVNWRAPYFAWYVERKPSVQEAASAAEFYAENYGRPEFDEWWRMFTMKGRSAL